MVLEVTKAPCKIGFIGAGKMAFALAVGIAKAKVASKEEIIMYDVSEAALKAVRDEGFLVAISNDEVIRKAEFIVLAVKPQIWPLVANSLKKVDLDIAHPKVIVSIMAGVTMATLSETLKRPLGEEVGIARVSVNTPALVGLTAGAFCTNAFVLENQAEFVKALLESVGIVYRLSEPNVDACVSLAGTGPAAAYVMIESLAEAGVKAGLPLEVAMRLSAQTLIGAGKMVLETGRHPAELKNDVCSPGGITICMVVEMEKQGFRNAVLSGVAAAAAKSEEIRKMK